MSSRELRILASEIIPCNEKIKYYSVDFPKRWFEKLSDIYKVIKCREKITLPINSLKGALEALPLGIIEVNPIYYSDNKYYKPWIMATDVIDSEVILNVVKSWCSIEFITKEDIEEDLIEKVSGILDEFKSEDIIINEKYLDLSETNVYENGTANPNSVIYGVLSNYIAQTIAENQENIVIGDESFSFVRYKNKLISVPVKEYKNCYYSINITFTVKTIIGYSKPILLIDTGISRWANGKFAESIGWKNKTRVLIRYNDGMSGGKFNGFTLGCDTIKRDFKEKKYKWADEVKEILEDATLAYLPELNKVIEKSTDYITRNEKYTLFITYNNDNNSNFNHSVKKGMSMNEKYEVCKQITEKFKFLQPTLQNEFMTVGKRYSGSKLNKGHSIKKYLDEIALREKELTLEIVYINKTTPNIIVKQLLEEINREEYFSEFYDNKKVSFKYNELNLSIKAIMAGDIVEPMKDFNSKVREVSKLLPASKNKSITIVEIYDKNHYKNGDPKFAIRKALYQNDRFNQFINYENVKLLEDENSKKLEIAKKKVESILENVLLELFRQLGVMYSDITLKGLKGVPDDLEIIGFNLLSTNYNKKYDTLSFPVAVSIRTGEKEIYVKTPINDWMEYSEAILFLGKNNGNQKKYEVDEINTFFRDILNDANDSDSLVLVDTSNRLNSILKDFQDKELQINKVYTEYNNIRLIRVKNNLDVPACVGVNDIDDAYFLSGLKKITDNVFYSTQGKTTTYKGIRSDEIKLKALNKEFKIPSALEIVPIKLNKDDDIESFAYFVHMLRQLNITYDDYSAVPMVNHLAKSFQEVLLVKDVEMDDEY